MIYTVVSLNWVDGEIEERLETSFLDERRAMAFAQEIDTNPKEPKYHHGVIVRKLEVEGGQYQEIYKREDGWGNTKSTESYYPSDTLAGWKGIDQQVRSGPIDASTSAPCGPVPFFDIVESQVKPVNFLTLKGIRGRESDSVIFSDNSKGKLDE